VGAERERVAGFGHLEDGLWGKGGLAGFPDTEYFHGGHGAATGAAHQTGRAALIADVVRRRGEVQTAGDIVRRYVPKAQP
jgi:hypothetical protein